MESCLRGTSRWPMSPCSRPSIEDRARPSRVTRNLTSHKPIPQLSFRGPLTAGEADQAAPEWGRPWRGTACPTVVVRDCSR